MNEVAPVPEWLKATKTDLQQVDVGSPIAASIAAESQELSRLFRASAEAERQIDERGTSASRIFDMLSAVTGMYFKADERNEPFGAMMTLSDGRRTAIPSDFRERTDLLATMAEQAINPVLRARLCDVVWLLDRKRANLATAAVVAYFDIVREVEQGRLRFSYSDERGAHVHDVRDYLRRALQIGRAIGWEKPETRAVRSLAVDLRLDALKKRLPIPISWFCTLDLDFKLSDPADVAADLDRFLASPTEDADVHTVVHLWRLTARGYHQSKNEAEKNRCHSEAAECLASHAEQHSESAMYASQFLADAITELSGVPGKKDRRTALRHRLIDIQARIPEEVSTFTQEMDLREIAEDIRNALKDKTLTEKLFILIAVDRSPDPQQLIDNARQTIRKHPLSSLFATSYMDREGKVVHRTKGGIDDDGAEEAIQNQIAQAESIRRHITVAGPIEAARQTILEEHSISSDVFAALLQHSPFVPRELLFTFSQGFARFLQGDFIAALYILTPLLENSLRHVLKQRGHDVSIFDDATQTQQDRTISTLFEQMRSELDATFSKATTTDIENVFLSKPGPSLRHAVAHGLLHDGSPGGADAIYACWLILRLSLVPLYPCRHELPSSIC